MRFLFIGSRFMLHASFPRSVTLTQLRFALLTVTSSQRDLHPQVCAHAGRTRKNRPVGRFLSLRDDQRPRLLLRKALKKSLDGSSTIRSCLFAKVDL